MRRPTDRGAEGGRDQQITVRLSAKERRLIDEGARAERRTTGAFMRVAALDRAAAAEERSMSARDVAD